MAVRIVTDSTSSIPADIAQALDITVVPLTVFFGDEALLDGVDISSDAFFERLVASPVLPRTSQPSVAQFAEVYAKHAADGHEIVSIHISDKLSGTLNSARAAAGDTGTRVEIIDTEGASFWVALVAMAAARAAHEGKSADEVAAVARKAVGQMRVYFVVDTLEYLQKGGRIGKAQALLGGLLSIKPLLRVHEGEVHPYGKVRTRPKALQRLHELVREGGPYQEIAVLHGTSPEDAAALATDLGDLTPSPVLAASVGAVIGVYTGPGVIGVATRRAD
jgi:DegV family protein with EDD domain